MKNIYQNFYRIMIFNASALFIDTNSGIFTARMQQILRLNQITQNKSGYLITCLCGICNPAIVAFSSQKASITGIEPNFFNKSKCQ